MLQGKIVGHGANIGGGFDFWASIIRQPNQLGFVNAVPNQDTLRE
jgi:hypothetical protein